MEPRPTACLHCHTELPAPAKTGRPRLFCNDACRVAHHRAYDPAEVRRVFELDDPTFPKVRGTERLALALAGFQDAIMELRLSAPEVETRLAWRCAELAQRVEQDMLEIFGEVFGG